MNQNQPILIIEDEPPFQEIYRDIFESKGFEVIVCDTAEDAKNVLSSTVPCLVLLDVILPGMSGLDVLEFIRSNQSTQATPVLVYSVIAEKEQVDRAMALGANDYTIKGQTPAVEVLEKALALIRGDQPSNEEQQDTPKTPATNT